MNKAVFFAGHLVVLLLIVGKSWAAVPQSLSYQGYLTDRVSSPIMDSQTITFSIYTVPVDDVSMRQETKFVPPNLFDVPPWLGMTIGTDSEMEPRRP